MGSGGAQTRRRPAQMFGCQRKVISMRSPWTRVSATCCAGHRLARSSTPLSSGGPPVPGTSWRDANRPSRGRRHFRLLRRVCRHSHYIIKRTRGAIMMRPHLTLAVRGRDEWVGEGGPPRRVHQEAVALHPIPHPFDGEDEVAHRDLNSRNHGANGR